MVRNAMGLARVSCARTFDTRVLEARIAGALSLNSFGEILDSVTFGRRLRTRFVVCAMWLTLHENRDDRSQLQACSMFSDVGPVAYLRVCPLKQRVLGHSRKHARGTETFERVCPRSVSLLQKSIDDVVLEGYGRKLAHAQADPKRETAPGEATSDVGSRWQSREIGIDR